MTDIVGLMSEGWNTAPRAVLAPPRLLTRDVDTPMLQAAFWTAGGAGPTTVTPEAQDDFATLAFVVDNEFRQELQVDDVDLHRGFASPGQYAVIPPGTRPAAEFTDVSNVLHLYIPTQMFQAVLPRGLAEEPTFAHSTRLHRKLVDLITWRQDANTDEARDMAAYGSLLRITAELARGLAPADTGERLTQAMVRHAKELMQANLAAPLKVADLAVALDQSEAHFARAFRNTTGATPGEALRKLRMQAAKALLENDTLGILEIAAEVGYADPSSFAKAFREAYGQTPAQWRRHHSPRQGAKAILINVAAK